MAQPGFFDFDERMKRLSDIGDQLEVSANFPAPFGIEFCDA